MQNELKEATTPYQGTGNGSRTSPCVLLNMDVKGQRARDRQFVQVFLSHKLKDRSSAKAVSEVLQANSAEKIRVFIAEDIAKGVVYQKEIEQQLYRVLIGLSCYSLVLKMTIGRGAITKLAFFAA